MTCYRLHSVICSAGHLRSQVIQLFIAMTLCFLCFYFSFLIVHQPEIKAELSEAFENIDLHLITVYFPIQ